MARAISMPTISTPRSPTCNACPTISVTASITALRTKASRNAFGSGWKKSGNYAPAADRQLRARQILPPLPANLPHSRAMFLQDAAIHHHEDPRLARLFRGLLVDHFFLHPDRRNFQLNCLVNNFFHNLGPTENIYDVDLLRHLEQGPVSFLAQTLVDSRIHWNDAISLGLHIRRYAMAGAERIAGEPDYGDGL